jgi:hypothetical protein
LPFPGVLRDTPNPDRAGDFDQLIFKGNPLIEKILFFHKESHTVILDDLIQINPLVKGETRRNVLLKLGDVPIKTSHGDHLTSCFRETLTS